MAVGTALVYMLVMGGWGAFMHVHLRSVDRRLAMVLGRGGGHLGLGRSADRRGAGAAGPRPGAGPLHRLRARASPSPGPRPAARSTCPSTPSTTRRQSTIDEVAGPDVAPDDRERRSGRRCDRSATPRAGGGRGAPVSTPLGGALVGGSLIGLLKGLFGVGGAFLIVPVISRVGRVPREVAVGSSLFAILVASLVAAVRHTTLGNVDGSDLLALVPGRAVRLLRRGAGGPVDVAGVDPARLPGRDGGLDVYLLVFRSAYQ